MDKQLGVINNFGRMLFCCWLFLSVFNLMALWVSVPVESMCRYFVIREYTKLSKPYREWIFKHLGQKVDRNIKDKIQNLPWIAFFVRYDGVSSGPLSLNKDISFGWTIYQNPNPHLNYKFS